MDRLSTLHTAIVQHSAGRSADMNAAGVQHGAGASTGVGEDLAFVARMLGDAAAIGAGSAANVNAGKPAHKRNRALLAQDQDAEPSDDNKVLLARHNRPSKKSNSKQYFCEACNCSVAARERDWGIHVSGIKHQRQIVSLLHTGQLGHSVLSLFEAEPGIDS